MQRSTSNWCALDSCGTAWSLMGWEEGNGLVRNNPSKVEPQAASAEELNKNPKNKWVTLESLSCGIRTEETLHAAAITDVAFVTVRSLLWEASVSKLVR